MVRVSDNGVGIVPEMLPRVFDLFAQSARTLNRAEGGLGIGLTLVRSLVEAHGGSVQAFSEGPGKGSEFVVRLPCRSRQDSEILNNDEPALATVAAVSGHEQS